MSKQLEERVAEHATLAEQAESSYTELTTQINKRLRALLEIRSLLLQLETRLYDQLNQFDKELEQKISSLKD